MSECCRKISVTLNGFSCSCFGYMRVPCLPFTKKRTPLLPPPPPLLSISLRQLFTVHEVPCLHFKETSPSLTQLFSVHEIPCLHFTKKRPPLWHNCFRYMKYPVYTSQRNVPLSDTTVFGTFKYQVYTSQWNVPLSDTTVFGTFKYQVYTSQRNVPLSETTVFGTWSTLSTLHKETYPSLRQLFSVHKVPCLHFTKKRPPLWHNCFRYIKYQVYTSKKRPPLWDNCFRYMRVPGLHFTKKRPPLWDNCFRYIQVPGVHFTQKRPPLWDNCKDGTLLCNLLPLEKPALPSISCYLSRERFLVHICIVRKDFKTKRNTTSITIHYTQCHIIAIKYT